MKNSQVKLIYRRGMAYLNLKDDDKAEKDFQEVLKIDVSMKSDIEEKLKIIKERNK